jgi:LacI family transcriptional regulator
MSIKQKRPADNSIPSLQEIASACGVSKATVSRALRDDNTQQSAETIARVKAIAREMGYDPSRSRTARRLALQNSDKPMINNTIGLFCEHPGSRVSTYFMRFLEGILLAASACEFEIQLTDAYRLEISKSLPMAYRSGEIDGILVPNTEKNFGQVRELLREEPGFANRPIVGLVDHMQDCSGVYADNFSAGWLAMTHLLDLGHRNILHFVDEYQPPTDVHGLRRAARIQAMYGRGMDPEKHLYYFDWEFGEDFSDTSSEQLIAYLKVHPEITAIIGQHDVQIGYIYKALVREGYRVPQDISLVGSDDAEAIIEHGENILTTIRLPLVEIGKQATQLLIRRIMGEETEERDVVLPVELIIRGTTAPPSR